MASLLDLMGAPAAAGPRPIWRHGLVVPGSDRQFTPCEDGDLRWLALDLTASRGRWFHWHGLREEWIAIDPDDRLGINAQADTPPSLAAIPGYLLDRVRPVREVAHG